MNSKSFIHATHIDSLFGVYTHICKPADGVIVKKTKIESLKSAFFH